ncbi:hypothetical protein ACU635_34580 [[Actinomadura] parvosata]|uniref:hypothetical protein n=1 Tax=[Actinomadura] parvosata TaxID=1955412 RepID=UPI00406D1B3E
MAAIAPDDHAAAEEIHATLLARCDGPPPDTTSLSVALRPSAHTLGELAVFLGHDDEAAAHLAQPAHHHRPVERPALGRRGPVAKDHLATTHGAAHL